MQDDITPDENSSEYEEEEEWGAQPKGSAEEKKPKRKPISARQHAANIRNARRSTGPKTPAGKARSSRNAVKYGIYADVTPIETGIMREDPLAMQITVDEIVESLRPRSPLERAAALEVAKLTVQLGRFHKLDAIVTGTHMTRDFEPVGDAVFDALFDVEHCARVGEILRRLPTTYTSEDWLDLLVAAAARDDLMADLVDLLDPNDARAVESMSDVIMITLMQGFDSRADAAEYFDEVSRQTALALPDRQSEASAATVGFNFQVKGGAYDARTRTLARLQAALDRALERYDRIRVRADLYAEDARAAEEQQDEDDGDDWDDSWDLEAG